MQSTASQKGKMHIYERKVFNQGIVSYKILENYIPD